jgi:hypothetical protein
MSFTPQDGKVITLLEAQELIADFKTNYPNEINSFFVGCEHVEHILVQEDCIGIRIINGFDSRTEKTTKVLVGVDNHGNDMDAGLIVDKLVPCPPVCPTNTRL